MAEESKDAVITDLQKNIERLERRVEELVKALYGDPTWGRQGFREEMERRIARLDEDIRNTKRLCDDLQQQRENELAERRGVKRVLGWTGVTNLLTLITLASLLIVIYQSGVFGG